MTPFGRDVLLQAALELRALRMSGRATPTADQRIHRMVLTAGAQYRTAARRGAIHERVPARA